jgi:hypothetical protein
MVLNTEGATGYTRDTTLFPDADYADATITDNPTAVTNYRAGKAFRVDVHPSPTAVEQITRTQLLYVSPTDDAGSSWASGIDDIVYADDAGAETFKQDFRIEGIHSDATKVDVLFQNERAGVTDTINCEVGQDTDDYTWDAGDNFLYVHVSYKTLGALGPWGIEARDASGYDFHEPHGGDTGRDDTDDDFIVVQREKSVWKEFAFVETPNDAIVTFNFPKQDINFAVVAGSTDDEFFVRINGQKASYIQQGGDVAADIVDGLKIAIDALSEPITVTDNGNDFDIEADDAALRFAYSSGDDGTGSITETVTEEGGGAAEGTLMVFNNRLLYKQSEYTEDQDASNENIIKSVTFTTAPATGDVLFVRALLAITREYDTRINQRRYCNPR